MENTTVTQTTRTVSEVLDQLWQIADDFGHDFVYRRDAKKGCSYVDYGYPDVQLPGCIVGQWAHRFGGVSLITLSTNEGYFNSLRAEAFGLDIEGEAITLLNEVQFRQDNGRPWGEAIRSAVEHLELNQ